MTGEAPELKPFMDGLREKVAAALRGLDDDPKFPLNCFFPEADAAILALLEELGKIELPPATLPPHLRCADQNDYRAITHALLEEARKQNA